MVRKLAIWRSRTKAFTRSSRTFFFSLNLLQNRTFCYNTPQPQPFNAETICRVLFANRTSTVDASLANIPVDMSPELAVDVLKKLSNAGVLALSFFRWAEKQQGFKHTTESFHELIESLGKIRQFKMIWTLLAEMNSKKLLTRETFSLISRRYARARKVKEAVEAFEKMQQFGMKPQVSDFNRLIDVLCKSKNVEKAQEVFDKMRHRKIVPDLKTYTILLEGWGTQGNLLRVDEAKKYESAVGLYHEMVAKGVKPSPHIYCTLINGLGSDKRLDEALRFFEMSKASGFPPEGPTYNAVIGAYCWSAKMEDAYRVVGEMKDFRIGPTSRTYDIILHHLIKARRNQEAYSVFRRMSDEFHCEPSVSTYEIIVRMFCNEGRLDSAMEVWDQMKSKGILPGMHMFSTWIVALCNEGRLDEACRYFQEMLDMGIRPPPQLFSSFKQALIDEGMENTAVHFALKIDKLRKTPLIA
ncbi:hypothetical protein PIB30_049451 [Stylosanthes scabra]|uniref:PROP1-like PPR domain-containing protein n=1 Tax=Stylosanthes scabra TaxID=79078 RepID=A0ABU6VGG9_9FABA|nr:hypothetical protein [Stylosanthes scabra]